MKERTGNSSRDGGILITAVLVLAFAVVLAGLGRLRQFRNQVQIRLDRQREIQQEFATRSALRWLEVDRSSYLPISTNRFGFETLRGEIGVSVCPAPDIFPQPGNPAHFDSCDAQNPARRNPERYPYVHFRGPNAGPTQWSTKDGSWYGFELGTESSSVGDTNIVEIDLSSDLVAALWTLDPYGRRYVAQFSDICQGTDTSEGDVVFLGLTPLGQSLFGSGGGSRSDLAVWLEQLSPPKTGDESMAPARLWIRDSGHDAVGLNQEVQAVLSKGLQIAGTHATIFDKTRIENKDETAIQSTHTYDSYDLGESFVNRFSSRCAESGGLRMTLGVSVGRPRSDDENQDTLMLDRFTRLAVTPAYEYTTVLDWKEAGSGSVVKREEQSTVVRVDVRLRPGDSSASAVTYDTHGTEATRKRQVR